MNVLFCLCQFVQVTVYTFDFVFVVVACELVVVLHQNNQSNGPIDLKWPNEFLQILIFLYI